MPSCPWRLQHSCRGTGETSEWCPWSHSADLRRNTANKYRTVLKIQMPKQNKNNLCCRSTYWYCIPVHYIWFRKRGLEVCHDFDPDLRDLNVGYGTLHKQFLGKIWKTVKKTNPIFTKSFQIIFLFIKMECEESSEIVLLLLILYPYLIVRMRFRIRNMDPDPQSCWQPVQIQFGSNWTLDPDK